MKAKEIIKTLELNLDKDIVLQECQRYEDKIPMIEIHSLGNGFVETEDGEDKEVVFINFLTTSKEEYWKRRCLLAEDVIEEICIDEIVVDDEEAKKSLNAYRDFIKINPNKQ